MPEPFPKAIRAALVHVAECAVHETLLAPVTVDDWQRLPLDAERHHLAPLLDRLARQSQVKAPATALTQLRALALRHARWHRTRTTAIREILATFEQLALRTLVLKGAALAWMIYPAPALRPMADVDLLVARGEASRAQAALRRLGFNAPVARRRFGRHAHHLSTAVRVDAGLPLHVEVHVDALSQDTLASIALTNLSEVPRPFLVDGTCGLTLGHVDMLRHLVHHLLEPSEDGYVRLISVVDLLRYADAFHDQIDWAHVEKRFPFIINAFRCVHAILPLPAKLRRYVAPAGIWDPLLVGHTMRPLRSIARTRSPIIALSELLAPPTWWMYAYYNVPLGRPLAYVRLVRHPWRVTRWLGLRLRGY